MHIVVTVGKSNIPTRVEMVVKWFGRSLPCHKSHALSVYVVKSYGPCSLAEGCHSIDTN